MGSKVYNVEGANGQSFVGSYKNRDQAAHVLANKFDIPDGYSMLFDLYNGPKTDKWEYLINHHGHVIECEP